MKKNRIKLNSQLFFLLFTIILSGGCKEVIEYELPNGQLIGNVILLDIDQRLVNDKGGVQLTIEGANPQITVLTDEEGVFTINDLKSGTYNLVFNKEGFNEYRINGYQFVGGDKITRLNNMYLFEESKAQITSLSLAENDYTYYKILTVEANIINSDWDDLFYGRYFLSDSPDVSYFNYQTTDVIQTSIDDNYIQGNLSYTEEMFPSGSELYMILYPSYAYHQYYIDLETGLWIYTTINDKNPSPVASIIIP